MEKKLERSRWAAVAGALLATAAVGWIGTARGAPSSEEITLQARITDPGGQPITNTLTLHFRLVDERGVGVGTPAWSETLTDVSVVNGILSVVLGSQNPLTPSLDLAGGERFIEIWLGSDTSGQRLGAVKVTAAAYAVAAGSAERIWNPTTGTADDIAALDSRYVLASGGGADVVRTVNGQPPGPSGDFTVAVAGGLSLAAEPNGIRITGSPGTTLNGLTGEVTLAGGAGVQVTKNGQTITISGSEPVATVLAPGVTAEQINAALEAHVIVYLRAGEYDLRGNATTPMPKIEIPDGKQLIGLSAGPISPSPPGHVPVLRPVPVAGEKNKLEESFIAMGVNSRLVNVAIQGDGWPSSQLGDHAVVVEAGANTELKNVLVAEWLGVGGPTAVTMDGGRIESSHVYKCTYGFSIQGAGLDRPPAVVEDSTASDCEFTGFDVAGDNVRVRGCTATSNRFGFRAHGPGAMIVISDCVASENATVSFQWIGAAGNGCSVMNCVAAASSNNGTFGFLFAATAGDRALAALLRASGHMQNYDVDDSWAKVQLIVTNP